MESTAGVLVKVDDLDKTSNYKLEVRLGEMIVDTTFKWQAKRIERALCAEIQALVKDLRLLLSRDEVHADTNRTAAKHEFKVSLAFTVEKIDAERAHKLTECLETFVESLPQLLSGHFDFAFMELEDPRGFSFTQKQPREYPRGGIDTLLLATRIIQEDQAAQA